MSNNILFGNVNQEIGKAFRMNDLSKIIGQNVARHREMAKMSQAELAAAIGVKSQNTIASIETGKTAKSKHLPAIARVLKVRLAVLDPSEEQDESVMVSALPASEQIDVYASVEAGAGALVVSNEPIQRAQRPKALEGIRGGYGVLVVGESMVPLIRPGYTVWVNPYLPPRPSEICLFIHDLDGEFRATVKEYCGQTPDNWLVRRYQPKQHKFSLNKQEWPKCHVVVGVDYGR